MTGYIRIKSPWVQLGIFLLVFSPQLALLVFSLFAGKPDEMIDFTDPAMIAQLKWTQAFSSLTFFLVPAFLYAVFTFRGRYGHFLGLKAAQKQNMYVLAILCLLLSMPAVFWLGALNEQIDLPEWMTSLEQSSAEQMKAFLHVSKPMDVVINVIVIALLPAFCEEIFFRGAMQRIMIHLTRNAWAGIIITAILFSALHLQFAGFLPRMFLGTVLGMLYWYSGSLWTSIAAHFVYNGVQVVWAAFTPTFATGNPETTMLAVVASAVAVAAILLYYRRQSVSSFAGVYGDSE